MYLIIVTIEGIAIVGRIEFNYLNHLTSPINGVPDGEPRFQHLRGFGEPPYYTITSSFPTFDSSKLGQLFDTFFASVIMETASNIELRSPQAPSSIMSTRGSINFMHPGYTPPQDLFSLPKVDSTAMGKFGVHFGTAIIACQIIANNAFDTAYLALDIEGQQRVSLPFDNVLTESWYYLHVSDRPGMTPIS
jgi:hypothetical protein